MRNNRLTQRQRALVSALLEHATVARASEVAGIPLSTAHRWMQQPEFAAAVRTSRRVLTDRATAVLQSGMTACAAKLRKMAMDESLPASIQLTAARTVLELGYRGDDQDIQAQIDEIKEMLADAPESKKGLRAA